MYNRVSKETIFRVKTLYLSGMSQNGIAKALGRSRQYVWKRLRNSGIHIRTQSESETLKWSQMSVKQRQEQVKSAHNAVRGTKVKWSTKCKHAKTVEKSPSNFSENELIVKKMLFDRGIKTVHQKAIGAYNCDLAAKPVAVEIWSGYWHFFGKHARLCEKRFCYILNRGWFIYVLPITVSFPLTNAVADYLAAYIKHIRRDKPQIRTYRVVWAAGDFAVSGSLNRKNFPIVPPFTNRRNPVTGQYERIPR